MPKWRIYLFYFLAPLLVYQATVTSWQGKKLKANQTTTVESSNIIEDKATKTLVKFFAGLLSYSNKIEDEELKKQVENSITEIVGENDPEFLEALKEIDPKEAEYTFQKIVILIFFVTAFFIVGAISLLYLLTRLANKSIQSNLTQNRIATPLLLEIFTLYILGMLFIPKIAKFYKDSEFIKSNYLLFNIISIPCLLILVFWPKLSGAKIKDTFTNLGLRFGSVKKFFSDIFIAPIAYSASWIILITFIIAYSVLMEKLGINPNEGAHPIIPILGAKKDPFTFIYVIVLAVVVAPIVEEIMFRGALYSWLREHLGITVSVIASAFIFAVVHPQGPIGILPLSLIGIFLALLREWRDTLTAPIVAHACFNGGTLLLMKFVISG